VVNDVLIAIRETDGLFAAIQSRITRSLFGVAEISALHVKAMKNSPRNERSNTIAWARSDGTQFYAAFSRRVLEHR